MKPHEETWTIDPEDVECGDYSAMDPDGFHVVTTYARGPDADALAEGRLALVSAAPEMARALLALHKSITFEERTAARIMGDEALKKAGVLP